MCPHQHELLGRHHGPLLRESGLLDDIMDHDAPAFHDDIDDFDPHRHHYQVQNMMKEFYMIDI